MVKEVFEDADELEKDLTEVSKRIKHLDEEELAKMHGLLSTGFPSELVERIEADHRQEKRKSSVQTLLRPGSHHRGRKHSRNPSGTGKRGSQTQIAF